MPPLGGKIGRAASGVVLDIDHTKFNKISTKYRTQHFIAQNIDQQNFFKMRVIASLQHYTFRDQKVHADFAKTVL